MQFSLLYKILRSRFLLIMTLFVVTAGAALVGSLLMTKQYRSSTELHIDVRSVDPVTGQTVYTQQTPQQYLATQADIIKSERVLRYVVTKLNLGQNPTFMGPPRNGEPAATDIDSLALQLSKGLDVEPSIEGSIIALTYDARSPQLAADIVNAFAEGYVKTVIDLKNEPAGEAAKWFEGEAGAARATLEDAQQKLSAFVQSSGIVSKDEQFDVENLRLNDLAKQLTELESAKAEAQSRLDTIRRRGRDSMPEVATNALVQALTTDVGRAEAKVRELGSRLGENNPQLRSAQAELSSLRGRLSQEIARVGGSVEAQATISIQREGAIRKQYEAQREKVLQFKTERDQMAILQRDVDTAQKELEQLNQRAQDTRVSSRANITNVTVLSKGTVATIPVRPKPLLSTVVGGFLGLLVGFMGALMLEVMQRPVRTAEDLRDSLSIPVLAVLPPSNSTRAQRLLGGGGPTMPPPMAAAHGGPGPLRLGH